MKRHIKYFSSIRNWVQALVMTYSTVIRHGYGTSKYTLLHHCEQSLKVVCNGHGHLLELVVAGVCRTRRHAYVRPSPRPALRTHSPATAGPAAPAHHFIGSQGQYLAHLIINRSFLALLSL